MPRLPSRANELSEKALSAGQHFEAAHRGLSSLYAGYLARDYKELPVNFQAFPYRGTASESVETAHRSCVVPDLLPSRITGCRARQCSVLNPCAMRDRANPSRVPRGARIRSL